MPTISAIQQQKKFSQRYNVFLDGKFAFGVDAEDLLKFGLYQGKELSSQELKALYHKSKLNKLYLRALDYLSYRPRSVKEVHNYLQQKISQYQLNNHSNRVLAKILSRLTRLNLINDAEFTHWWIRQRTQATKPYGPYYIRSELHHKGIKPSLFEQIWQKESINEHNLCQRAAEKKARSYNLVERKAQRKLFNYLTRRGFSFEVAQSVLEELLAKEAATD